MLLEVPPNIWLEIHSSLTVSNSIPAQRVREKRKGEEKKGRNWEEKKKKKKMRTSKRSNQSTGWGFR